ncbi:MAG: signal peptidase I [Oligoflexia bacterium]|nr:signal peptidase I [Oligoflexia bacterium]
MASVQNDQLASGYRPSATPPPGGAGSGVQISEVLSFLRTVGILVILAVFLRGSVVEAFKIPSGSMIPTLMIGDHILVSKFSYGLRLPFFRKSIYQFSTPRRGDVVVFTRPDDPSTPHEDESQINIIKRVIGLPGDTVEVRGTTVYINNSPLSESYARWEEGGVVEGNFGPEIVPAGHIFLMGDNRDHSKDSRYWTDPFLDVGLVKGRALIIYWSWDSLSRISTLIR